jgi:hypothetical protein
MSKRRSEFQDLFDEIDSSSSTKGFGSGLLGEFGMGAGSRTSKTSHHGYTPRCYEGHPPLKLPGTELVIYGGSCIQPSVTDVDVYIGFDSGMRPTQRSWPWKKGEEFLFKITDMHAPDDAAEFKKLVGWTVKRLEAGSKVHCGCIGGHGRTGTFLAALVAHYGEKDAIDYVRKNYCQKAVESGDQVQFLKKHFGITAAVGTKSTGPKSGKLPSSNIVTAVPAALPHYDPIVGRGSIWG